MFSGPDMGHAYLIMFIGVYNLPLFPGVVVVLAEFGEHICVMVRYIKKSHGRHRGVERCLVETFVDTRMNDMPPRTCYQLQLDNSNLRFTSRLTYE